MSRRRSLPEIAVLGALASAPHGLTAELLVDELADVDLDAEAALAACETLVRERCVSLEGESFVLTPHGGTALLEVHASIERALDPSPTTPGMEICPSLPWLTTVRTEWNDALSLNYAVDPDALAKLLPAPLEPEIFHGRAWVQVLASRLREMRPQGMPGLFGVDFHQVSYRAAVTYTGSHGPRRGGYFVRSETDHAVMRAIGNALVEFRFHDFEAAKISLARKQHRLTFRSESRAGNSNESAFVTSVELDVGRDHAPPRACPWTSREDLGRSLVECYDAFGVTDDYVYVLTIDREPWREAFADPLSVRVDWMSKGPLAGAATFDSALYLPKPCRYTWRPLRRERIPR